MTRAHGIDISHWNSAYSHPANPPLPVDFVVQRVGYGLNKDESLSVLTPPILAEKIKAAYHYPSSAVPWKDQADFFLQLMDGKYDFWALDPEKSYNGSSLANMVVPMMDYLLKYSGKPGLLYTNPDMWGTWFAPIQQDLLKYELWVAHYWYVANPEGTPNYYTVPGASTMRRDWRFWQYTVNKGGGPSYGSTGLDIDLDVFNGDLSALQAWVGVTTTPPPPPHPAICPTCGQPWIDAPINQYYVNKLLVNVRSEPRTTASWVAYARLNETFTIYETSSDYSRIGDGRWIYSAYLTKKG